MSWLHIATAGQAKAKWKRQRGISLAVMSSHSQKGKINIIPTLLLPGSLGGRWYKCFCKNYYELWAVIISWGRVKMSTPSGSVASKTVNVDQAPELQFQRYIVRIFLPVMSADLDSKTQICSLHKTARLSYLILWSWSQQSKWRKRDLPLQSPWNRNEAV